MIAINLFIVLLTYLYINVLLAATREQVFLLLCKGQSIEASSPCSFQVKMVLVSWGRYKILQEKTVVP